MRSSPGTSLWLALPILFCLSVNAFAQQMAIDLDPAQTEITFVLGDVLHTVRGTFRLKSGRVLIDPAAQTIAGLLVVNANSGESGNGIRDKRMKRDILEADRYPEIAFAPAKIASLQPMGETFEATISGWFTIHGERHEIAVPVHIKTSGPSVTANARFVAPYVQWGMKNPSTLFLRVNDKVDVEVNAMGQMETRR